MTDPMQSPYPMAETRPKTLSIYTPTPGEPEIAVESQNQYTHKSLQRRSWRLRSSGIKVPRLLTPTFNIHTRLDVLGC